MDDNNKYNRNKDYEPDNFDDEVAFPARRNNAPERSSDIQEDYGDNFDNDVKFVGDYDEDAVQMPEIDFEDDMETPVKMPSERDDRTQTPDYGDNFDSQTGEQVSKATKDFQYDLSSDDIGNYYTKSTIHPKRKKVVKKKKRTSRNVAVILTIAAVICLIVAVVFAFTQCSSQKNDNKASTAPSTEQVTTVQPTTEYGDDNYVPVYTEEPTYEPPTEYQPEKRLFKLNRRQSISLKQSRSRAVISVLPNRHRLRMTLSRHSHPRAAAMNRMLKKTDCFLLIK